MKNISLLINAVLLIAVGVLYYLHFNSGKKTTGKTEQSKSVITSEDSGASPSIAYVELDSLNEKITVIKNKRKELEAEQRAIETEWENGYRGLETQRNNFLKRGNAITQQEAEQMQETLIRQQQQIDEKKQNLSQKLSEKSFKSMEQIQKQLKEFLEEYNREKKYMYIFTTGTGLDYMVYKDPALDITADVIAGMNEKLDKSSK